MIDRLDRCIRLTPRRRRHQRGATLFETLIAFVIAATSTLAAGYAMQPLRLHAEAAQQRTVALGLAADALEEARSIVRVGEASGSARFEDLVDDAFDSTSGNATYRVLRTVVDAGGDRRVRLDVAWRDRQGSAQSLGLDGIVAGVAPAHVAALSLAGAPETIAAPWQRARGIPPQAVRVRIGRSAWWPAPGAAGGTVLVFDDATGDVVAQCDAGAVTLATLAAGDASGCSTGRRLLVSGTVRFAGGTVRPLAITLAGAGYAASPMCQTEIVRTLRQEDAARGVVLRDIALAADAASLGLAGAVDTGERSVAWRCLIEPADANGWSGALDVRADGWSFGTVAGTERLCRVATDRDGSGSIDQPDEHPATWHGVTRTLTAQSFVVIAGDRDCADVGAWPASPA